MAKRNADAPVTAITRKIMQRVRGHDTAPEVAVRRWLHARGLRFRLHRKDLPGKPDVVLPARRIAIFVHGCFWHRHRGCARTTSPKTRQAFWVDKFAKNVARDRRNIRELKKLGWHPVVVWECRTKNEEDLARALGPTLDD